MGECVREGGREAGREGVIDHQSTDRRIFFFFFF